VGGEEESATGEEVQGSGFRVFGEDEGSRIRDEG
jgi:hypothetical protein